MTLPSALTAEQIKAIRAELGMSQPKFAAALGVKVDTVRAWEYGQARPSIENGERVDLLTQPHAIRKQRLRDVLDNAECIAAQLWGAYNVEGDTDEAERYQRVLDSLVDARSALEA